MEPVKLIIDTDIGPDVDDVGALAMAFQLQKRGKAHLLAVTHCTSNPYGAGCIDVIARSYGFEQLAIGSYSGRGFLDGEQYQRYNRTLCERYANRYPNGQGVDDAVQVLRKALAEQPEGSVRIAAIGPLTNLKALLCSPPDDITPLDGAELVRRQVELLVVMGGGPSNLEWNFQMDPAAAAFVTERWPSPCWYTEALTGWDIVTGTEWYGMEPDHPVRTAFSLYAPQGRMSWDQTAIWAAVMGPFPFFQLSRPRTICCCGTSDGHSHFEMTPQGKDRYLYLACPIEQTERAFDALMCAGRLPEDGDAEKHKQNQQSKWG